MLSEDEEYRIQLTKVILRTNDDRLEIPINEILTESEDDAENQDDLDEDQDSSNSRYSADSADQSKIEAKSIAKSIRNE